MTEYNFDEGVSGVRAGDTRWMFLLHRSDSRAIDPEHGDWWTAFQASQTGRNIKEMLGFTGHGFEDFFFTNLYKYLLPNDRMPSADEYQRSLAILEEQIADFQPRKILASGAMVHKHLFGDNDFSEKVGSVRTYKGVPTLLMYHPGRTFRFPKEQRIKNYSVVMDFLSS